jgi:2-polyprenyl-3-methyl-5-hydroxy-6-metoxy-1,4-benzoquinol methylase
MRHHLRKLHFFDPLIARYGGSLKKKRVLDLGCCQGFWSFLASRANAQVCLGIDSSEAFVSEAKAIAEVLAIQNCEFRCHHLENDPWWNSLEPFQITFFLGLFYHLADPIFVFRRAASLTQETMVIDTEIIPGEGSFLTIVGRDPQEPTTARSNIFSKIRLIPTRQALYDLLSNEGFSVIQYLQPRPPIPPEYLSGYRLSIIARRE